MRLIDADALKGAFLEELFIKSGKSVHGVAWAIPCKDCKRNYTDKYETLFARLEIIEDRNELLHTIQSEFEAEEARAFADQTKGLKEHAVWNKAIRILEEYIV